MARAPGEFRGENDYLPVELVTRPEPIHRYAYRVG